MPPGSALLWSRGSERRPAGTAAISALQVELPAWAGPYDHEALGHRWQHADPRVERLYADVSREVERGASDASEPAAVIERIRALAYAAAGRSAPELPLPRSTRFVPRLSESWFCCAEPSREQMTLIGKGCVSSCRSRQ